MTFIEEREIFRISALEQHQTTNKSDAFFPVNLTVLKTMKPMHMSAIVCKTIKQKHVVRERLRPAFLL